MALLSGSRDFGKQPLELGEPHRPRRVPVLGEDCLRPGGREELSQE
jgi:hypothetical protein